MSDNKIIIFLVFALIAQILFLLWHMNIIGSSGEHGDSQRGKVAGHIENIENQLKRRPLDSLIWESSKNEEKIYYFDSVLTLSESTARVVLDNGTQIQLSENTLITIEPPDPSSPDEIRIQFNKGNLKARNPYAPAEINDGTLKLSLNANSDVEIVKNADDQYEVLLNTGSARLEQGDKQLDLNQNELISINKTEIEKVEINKDLQWKTASPQRVYAHGERVPLELEWAGQAEKILIFSKNYLEKEIDVAPDQTKAGILLPFGDYRAILNSKSRQSQRLQLELWKAPIIQLVQPLPRNRNKFGDLEFIWTPTNRVVSYELELKSGDNSRRQPSNFNKLTESFKQEEDLQWGIWGVDQKGFKVPPLYYYPLYIRENPFSAPKLNKPKLIKKKPGDFRSSWMQLFISPAWAADSKRQALFSWEAIEGAEIYVLEISDQPEFRNPLVKIQLEKPEYLWTKAEDEKIYYWRVAAGNRSGRMGIFSEPIEVVWEVPVEKKVEKPVVKKVSMKPKPAVTYKKPEPPPKPTPKPKPIEKVRTPPLPQQEEKAMESRLHSIGLFYQPAFVSKSFTENGNTKANLTGMVPLSASAQIDFYWNHETLFSSLLNYQTSEFEPDPKNQFPFQPNLSVQQITFLGQWLPVSTGWGFGIFLGILPTVERVDFEEVKAVQKISYGPIGSYKIENDWVRNLSTLGPISNGKHWGAFIKNRTLFPLLFEGFLMGVDLQYIHLTSGSLTDSNADISFIIGYKF